MKSTSPVICKTVEVFLFLLRTFGCKLIQQIQTIKLVLELQDTCVLISLSSVNITE